MRCTNCGLPLSPARQLTNCPRCGAPLNTLQGAQPQQQPLEQPNWAGGMGGANQPNNLWGQGSAPTPGSFSPFSQASQGGLNANGNSWQGNAPQQSPLSPQRPSSAPTLNKLNPRLLFMVAGLFVLLAAMLLGLVFVIGSHSGGSSPNTASTSLNTSTGKSTPQAAATQAATPTDTSSTPDPNATSTPDANSTPAANGTAYPGQQYIDSAQMAAGIDQTTLQAVNPSTTFKVGSSMYVVFQLHPPSQGGAVCSIWYLGGKQLTTFASAVKPTSHASYTYAIYGSPGQAYVELYWASSKSCSDKVLAQHVDFTVTA